MLLGERWRGKEFGVRSYCRFTHPLSFSFILCPKFLGACLDMVITCTWTSNKSIEWTPLSWFICECLLLTSLVIPSPKRVPRYWFTRVHKAPLSSQSLLSLNWWQMFYAVTTPKQPSRVPLDNVTLELPVHWKALSYVMNLTYPWGFFNPHWIACIFRPFIGDRDMKMWLITW